MNDSTINEISTLFQELIVSKIKDELELLKKEIDDVKSNSDEIDDMLKKLPKRSTVKKICEEEISSVTTYIEQLSSKSKSEKYLKDIVEYLKIQFGFMDKKTLCKYLEDLSVIAGNKIDSILDNQDSLSEKYEAIFSTLEEFKISVLSCISENQKNLLDEIKQTEKEIINCHLEETKYLESILENSKGSISGLSDVGKGIEEIGETLKSIETKENVLINNLSGNSEILDLLNKIYVNVGYANDGDDNETLKVDLMNVDLMLRNLLQICQEHENWLNTSAEEYKNENKKRDQIINLLAIFNMISCLGVIALLVIQFV